MKIALLLLVCLATAASAQTMTQAQRVDKFLKDAREAMKIPGLTFAVVKDGKIVQKGALGEANLTYHVPTEIDTPFLLASVTKQFTAAAIMKLVEEGKVKLDASVTGYIADSPEAWRAITVRHLLHHTAGLKHRFEDADMTQWKLYYTKDALTKAAKATAVDTKPGETWQYSDQGYFLLGLIVEKASGKSYREYLAETFFTPLGMTSSTTLNLDEIVPKLAQGYMFQRGKWFNNNRRTEYGMTSHFGVVSTVEDMAKWSTALDEGKVVKPESLALMWSAGKLGDGSTPVAVTGAYGFGWFLDRFNGHRIVEHGGSTGTELYKLPEDKLTVIVLTNLEQITGGDAGFLARSIAKIYVPEMAWSNLKPLKAKDASLTKVIEDEVRRAMKGEMDLANYDDAYGKALKPALAAQKPMLAQLGELKAVKLVREDEFEGIRTLGYRLEFVDATFFATLKVNGKGKIAFFVMEIEDLPS